MISVEEALEKILGQLNTLEAENKELLDSLGQVTVEDIFAPFDLPLRDNSAMDGYALKANDIKGASEKHPVLLKVIGEIPAGVAPKVHLKTGECVRIMTGGIMPDGADVVVPLESTDDEERSGQVNRREEIGIFLDMASGLNIRKTGEDLSRGTLVVGKGKVLRPSHIGILASLGISRINVVKRPVIAIIATGNELVDVKQKLLDGKIYNSNSYAIASQVREFGGIPKIIGIAKDNIEDLTRSLRESLKYDLVITSGGVSVGDYDFVKKALTIEGEMLFWRVQIKPGKPITFGILSKGSKKVPHLGLPGNPVSCMIVLEIFGRPAIFKMLGREAESRKIVWATMQDEIVNTDARRIFARVVLEHNEDGYYAQLTGPQGSAVLMSMVKANGLAIVPETTPVIKKGDKIQVLILD